MVRYLKLLVVMIATMLASPAMAFTPPPAPTIGSIVDQSGTLSQVEIQRLNMQIKQINQSSANQIGILVIPALNGDDIRKVGYDTGKAWGVGQRDLDNGVMIVWSRGDRKVGIETGKGVGADLPDLLCNDIITNVIAPNFKQRRFFVGLSQGIDAINQSITDHRQALAERQKRDAQRLTNNNVPQTTTTPNSGCDISGVQRAGMGGTMVWIALLLSVVWMVRRHYHRMLQQSDTQREQQQTTPQQEQIDSVINQKN